MSNKMQSSTTVTLYGSIFNELEKFLVEHEVSFTAFYNTVAKAFIDGDLVIGNTENLKRRIYLYENEEEVLAQLLFEVLDKDGKRIR